MADPDRNRTWLLRTRGLITTWKVYIIRSARYGQIINTIMLIFLFLIGVNDTIAKVNIYILYPTMIGISLFLLIFSGWVDDKTGLFMTETNMISSRNPYFVTVRDNTEEIKERLKRIEERLG